MLHPLTFEPLVKLRKNDQEILMNSGNKCQAVSDERRVICSGDVHVRFVLFFQASCMINSCVVLVVFTLFFSEFVVAVTVTFI